ncbi:hopanoid biosynthesis-associated protein HpnK [Massilia horti]|uniref:ChbG/HpnK family deacetylase n=1 Tax=Massilia horti TaxID=2562153 RepID=A0A4Y9STN2_9BURK|nr:hopanoid biosynthesis-associated protein HpnK [Massilia horti]TFW28003.1 ChbG/HpnK family deacetylase [Massilia horti]
MRAPGLIITADDFGLHASVNKAIVHAFREGVLDCASLMMAGPATRDAVARARACPSLAVGLHLVLADGRAVLPPRWIPDLVDADGRFGARMVRDSARFFLHPRVRRQLAAEIRAQFEAFADTGLRLDHVNAHKHFHLHPTILSMLISIGRPFGMTSVRLPLEDGTPPWLRPWLALLAHRLDAAGVFHNDYIVGIRHSGRFDEAALLAALGRAPRNAVGEIYLHPALESGAAIASSMPAYRHADEYAALVSPRVRSAREQLRIEGFRFGGFADLAPRA